jgi:hypothetical protein
MLLLLFIISINSLLSLRIVKLTNTKQLELGVICYFKSNKFNFINKLYNKIDYNSRFFMMDHYLTKENNTSFLYDKSYFIKHWTILTDVSDISFLINEIEKNSCLHVIIYFNENHNFINHNCLSIIENKGLIKELKLKIHNETLELDTNYFYESCLNFIYS